MQFDRRAVEGAFIAESRIFLAGDQMVRAVILDIHRIGGHEPLKNAVDCFQQPPAATEIGLQVDHLPALAVPSEELLALEKSRSLRQSEAVYTLLHIADAEEIARLRRRRHTFSTDQR